VRGFADQRLRKPDAPLDPSNRRISLIVQYLDKKAPDPADEKDSKENKENKEGAAAAEPKGEKPAAAEH
jgi:chemotaxis protein MotB